MKNFLLLVLSISPAFIFAQEIYVSNEIHEDFILIHTDLGTYRFESFGERGIDVHFKEHEKPTFNRNSLSTLMPIKHRKSNLQLLQDQEEQLKITLNGNVVEIHKQPFIISYFDMNEKQLMQQKGIEKVSDSVNWLFEYPYSDFIFGGGARSPGLLNLSRLELYNKAHYGYENFAPQMNFSMPIVLSPNYFMIHFDNTSKGSIESRETMNTDYKQTIEYQAVSGEKRYQIIFGNNMSQILQDYTLLTGLQPLPPRWALGNFASRFGYHSSREVNELVKKYKKEKIPLDAVILDLYWFGKTIQGTMGNLAFDRDSFPKPKKFLRKLNKQGINPIVITEPFILTTSDKWKEALKADILCKDSSGQVHAFDFYFGNTGLIDVFDPKAQQWFWKIYKQLHDQGVRGVWGDLGEPEVHPEAILHYGDLKANDIHNAYGHQWAKIIYDGYQRDFPNERLFNLMRAGAPGSQKYGMIPWSGDVNRTWGGLQSQPGIALSMSLQGMAYMHSDLGGFAGNNDDPELYTRWLQYGVFQPIFRPHAQEEVASEPVFKDPETLSIVKQAIELRYKLLPYNYNLMHINSTTGIPLMRPIYFDAPYPFNARVFLENDHYYWGDDFLISPVLQKDAKVKNILVPKSSKWIDFYTLKCLENNEDFEIYLETPLFKEYIPTYVRAGAIIPMVSNLQNTKQYLQKNIELHFFLHPEVQNHTCTFVDDNDLPENHPKYKKDTFEISYEFKNNSLNIKVLKNQKIVSIFDKNIFIHYLNPNISVFVNEKSIDQNTVKPIYNQRIK